MSLSAAAVHLLGARSVRRLLGCGCLCLIALIAMPVLVLFSVVNGLIPGDGGAGVSQVDASAGMVVGGAEPLAPGHFRVSQGFGCTALSHGAAARLAATRAHRMPPTTVSCGFTRVSTWPRPPVCLCSPSLAGRIQVVESTIGFGIHILLTPSTDQAPAVTYLYGHLSEVAVADGDVVRAGDPIGYVGTTGNSTGPHLHFEVDVGGVPVNPCADLSARLPRARRRRGRRVPGLGHVSGAPRPCATEGAPPIVFGVTGTDISATTGYAWSPTPEQVERSRLRSFMTQLGVDDLEELNDVARRDPERFWAATIDDIGIGWLQRPTRMRDTGEGLPFTRWWTGGRLNLATNAADRWAQAQPGRDAVVWEGDDGSERVWSYLELAAETARCANGLRELGVGPGDAVGVVPAHDPRDGGRLPRLRQGGSHRHPAVQRVRSGRDRGAPGGL